MIRSSVDLPRPLGPMIATRSPRRTSSDRSVSTRFSPYDLLTPASSSTSRPLGRSGTTLNCGVRRELSASSATSIFSICLRRLCACVALVFLAPKRSTQARLRAISSSARATEVSARARVASFSTTAFE